VNSKTARQLRKLLPTDGAPRRTCTSGTLARPRQWPSKGNDRARKRAWAKLSHVQRGLLLADPEALRAWARRVRVEEMPLAELTAEHARLVPGAPVPRCRTELVERLLEIQAA